MQRRRRPISTFPASCRRGRSDSREMTAALLQAGAEMLRKRSLAELSIEALCGEVGATVGAFYSRFESKEAYFNTLMEIAARDGERNLAQMTGNERLADAGLADALPALSCSAASSAGSAPTKAFAFAALQHDDTRPDRWNTFKGLARATAAGATPPLLRAMRPRPRGRQDPRHRVRLSGGAGDAGQRHPQRSRTAVPPRRGDGGPIEPAAC